MKIRESEIIEYINIVKPILMNSEFKKRKQYPHHDKETVYTHSIKVSFLSYRFAKKCHLDYIAAARGGLLHDFYTKIWTSSYEKKPFLKKHGFIHAKEAYQNTLLFFPEYESNKMKDIIEKHMFPLTINLPKYKESWIITYVDKIVSLKIMMNPKVWYKYIKMYHNYKKKAKYEKYN